MLIHTSSSTLKLQVCVIKWEYKSVLLLISITLWCEYDEVFYELRIPSTGLGIKRFELDHDVAGMDIISFHSKSVIQNL